MNALDLIIDRFCRHAYYRWTAGRGLSFNATYGRAVLSLCYLSLRAAARSSVLGCPATAPTAAPHARYNGHKPEYG